VRVNLHGVWDSRLIAIRNPDEASYVESLTTAFKGQQLYGTPIDFTTWAEQSHQIAVEYVYTDPGFTPGTPPTRPVDLSKDYQNAASLAIDHQLELAGVRWGPCLRRFAATARQARRTDTNYSSSVLVILRVPTCSEARHVQSGAQEGQHRDADPVAGRSPSAARV
jgi:hypothetical protein